MRLVHSASGGRATDSGDQSIGIVTLPHGERGPRPRGAGEGLVIIVDDQATGRAILTEIVRSLSLQDGMLRVEAFDDAARALARIEQVTPDLIVTDYKMPGMDGLAFTRAVRRIPECREVPLVVVTIVEDREVRCDVLKAGASDFLNRPLDVAESRARLRNLLRLREQQRQLQERADWLEDQVRRATERIAERERETLLRLARAGEYRDEETGNHILRMARYSCLIAEALGEHPDFCAELEQAAPMHDIGKIGIPDRILLKPGRLTEAEFEIMKEHARIGHEILAGSPSRYLQLGAEIALHHHERYDGSGYPQGLAGEAIPLAARIVAVADVFDALTSRRPYKDPWPLERAFAYLREAAGSHFDPRCVEAFLACEARVREIAEHYRDDEMTQAPLHELMQRAQAEANRIDQEEPQQKD
ncbi:MAG TPA: response regulator [Thiotrichales bacterium]|nr:response regulator [Thiotrichales bacterium]